MHVNRLVRVWNRSNVMTKDIFVTGSAAGGKRQQWRMQDIFGYTTAAMGEPILGFHFKMTLLENVKHLKHHSKQGEEQATTTCKTRTQHCEK